MDGVKKVWHTYNDNRIYKWGSPTNRETYMDIPGEWLSHSVKIFPNIIISLPTILNFPLDKTADQGFPTYSCEWFMNIDFHHRTRLTIDSTIDAQWLETFN